MKKSIALVAMCATALSPVLAAPAFAAGSTVEPNMATAGTMQSMCASYVTANHGPTTVSADSTYYSFEVAVTDATDADPVFDPTSRVNDESSWTPDLTSVHTLNGPDASQSTALRRNGKSPNIFATDVRASSETWSNNSVDYEIDGTVTTTFTYQCDVTEHEWTPPVPPTPPTPPSGAIYDYELNVEQSPNANDDCDRFDGTEDFGLKQGNCILVGVTYSNPGDPGDPGEDGFFTDNDLGLQGMFDTIDQTSDPETYGPFTDDMAGPHTYFDTGALGHAVVCISPGSKGGTWRTQNGYTGVMPQKPCSTATFNSLPPGTSIPSNSLPVS